MKIDKLCNDIYIVAINEAKMQNHEYVTPEHYLYAVLMFDTGKHIISGIGGDLSAIKRDLNNYFNEKIPKVTNKPPTESIDFIHLFEFATSIALKAGKQIVELGDIIIAMFQLKHSHAPYILNMNNAKFDINAVMRISKFNYSEDISENNKQSQASDKDLSSQTLIDTYTVDLIDKAKKGLLDPLVGREDVIERTIQVLCRRLKNNPIHVGEAGVGKTSIVEGIAQRIADQDVPEMLKNSSVFYIDISLVVAGTKYRGDFEERLFKLIEEIIEYPSPIIYFDEIHTIMGAGAIGSGSIDAISILKPYMAKGDIRFIGSTTYDEYKKYFEKDSALVRRFQKIDVLEPTIDECINILNEIKCKYEEFHNVLYSNEVIELICNLSAKYMLDRHLPDKAIDILDETGAYVQIENNQNSPENIQNEVTSKDVERTVALLAKIPKETVASSETKKLQNLYSDLSKLVFGQDEAISNVSDAIISSRSGLKDPLKPIASFLFVGPTGVGKTEIAKQLANILGVSLKRFDMSEYQEKHSIARLIGSPPGYIGYEEGGILTETIKRTPYCVLLFDEFEKAHHDIFNIMLQIMDYGSLTDSTGKSTDFRNTIIIITSNAGASEMNKRSIGFEGKEYENEAINKAVEKTFSPEFRNRLDSVISFKPINEEMALQITKKHINILKNMLKEKNVKFNISQKATEIIAQKGFSKEYGAREIIRFIDANIKKELAKELVFGKLSNGGKVSVGYSKDKLTVKF